MRCFILLIIASLTGCSMNGTESKPAHGQGPQTDTGLSATPNSELLQFVDSINEFALTLHLQTLQEPENTVLSTESVATLLAMLLSGADGETADEICKAMHLCDRLTVADRVSELQIRVTATTVGPRAMYSTCNSIWTDSSCKLMTQYTDLIATKYRASTKQVDFALSPNDATTEINRWVSDVTKARIKQLFNSGQLTSATRVVALNAALFDGSWKQPFDREKTKHLCFYNRDGSTATIPTMSHEKLEAGYRRFDNWELISLPYTDSQYCLAVALPSKTYSLAALERELDAQKLRTSLDALKTVKASVKLPRFKVANNRELRGGLQACGIRAAFNENANFSKLTREAVSLGSVKHCAEIVVDESGTIAAGATGAELRKSDPRPIVIDRPFLFLVYHKETSAILFVGRVVRLL